MAASDALRDQLETILGVACMNLLEKGLYDAGLRESAAAVAADPLSALMLVGHARVLARQAVESNHPGVLYNAVVTW